MKIWSSQWQLKFKQLHINGKKNFVQFKQLQINPKKKINLQLLKLQLPLRRIISSFKFNVYLLEYPAEACMEERVKS